MTTVISLLGGPSTGKSTLTAGLYYKMKSKGKSVEMVREVAKEWAWEGRKIGPYDQIAIIGEQIRKECSLYDKVDYIITDSPVALGSFYMEFNHNETFMTNMVKDFYNMTRKNNIYHVNYLLSRNKAYDTKGRFESEEDAKKIDLMLESYLNNIGLDFTKEDDTSIIEVINEEI